VVLIIVVCTPLGFARIFTVMGNLIFKPTVSLSLWATSNMMICLQWLGCADFTLYVIFCYLFFNDIEHLMALYPGQPMWAYTHYRDIFYYFNPNATAHYIMCHDVMLLRHIIIFQCFNTVVLMMEGNLAGIKSAAAYPLSFLWDLAQPWEEGWINKKWK